MPGLLFIIKPVVAIVTRSKDGLPLPLAVPFPGLPPDGLVSAQCQHGSLAPFCCAQVPCLPCPDRVAGGR